MTVIRRALLIVVAIAVAAVLLRAQLSSALLTRGDSLAYYGDQAAARRAYSRAIALDADNEVAVDRIVFSYAFSGNTKAIADGISAATAFLNRHPASGRILMDRALCYQHVRKYSLAAADFGKSGTLAHDPRALLFAAIDSSRMGDHASARQLLTLAVSFDGSFVPTRRALSELR